MTAVAWVFAAAALVFAGIAVIALCADDRPLRLWLRIGRLESVVNTLAAENHGLHEVLDMQAEELAVFRRQSIKQAPKHSNVIDLIAHNEAARNLTDDQLNKFVSGDWTTGGDAS